MHVRLKQQTHAAATGNCLGLMEGSEAVVNGFVNVEHPGLNPNPRCMDLTEILEG